MTMNKKFDIIALGELNVDLILSKKEGCRIRKHPAVFC